MFPNFQVPVMFDGVHFHNQLDKFVADDEAFLAEKEKIKDMLVDEF